MFAATLRFAAGLAIGAAAALWLSRRSARHGAGHARIDETALDEAVEETFPASDPPAFTQPVISGAPSHAPRRRVDSEEESEAHPS